MKGIKIIIAGNLLPSDDNLPLFEKGESKTIFGEEVCYLFQTADFSIANLEGSLTDSAEPQKKDGSCIKAPKATISGIKNLGLSAVTLANDHIADFGQKGIDDTVEVLRYAGIQHVGITRKDTPLLTDKYLSLEISGKKICIYNVSDSFFNNPTTDALGVNVYDEQTVCDEIKCLKQQHDYLLVIYHGGDEFFQYPTPQTRTRFHHMADCGADFITAQHAHCIGCEEWYNGSYLLYGQGNFLFASQKKYPALTKQGLLTEVIITSEGLTVENHIVITYYDRLNYDAVQSLTDFKDRSNRLNDEEYILQLYKKLKDDEAKQQQGTNPLQRMFKWLFK